MSAFLAFTKKEFRESLRTYRLIILVAAFILLGVMSPFIALLTPALLKSVAASGLTINMPDPVAMDSWTQFFKNVGQLGMLALAIIFSGLMANELGHQTIVNLLTKGLSRHTVILSKFCTASVLWTVSYLLSLAVCAAYTSFYWPGTLLNQAFLSFLGLWLFGELLIALLLLGGTLFGSFYGSLLSCGAVVVVLNLVAIAPGTQKYNPVTLAGGTLSLLSGQSAVADFAPAMAISAAAIVVLVAATVIVFNKKTV